MHKLCVRTDGPPFAPGMVVFVLGRWMEGHGSRPKAAIVIVVCIAVFNVIAFVNERATRKLQGESNALGVLEGRV